MHQIKVYIASKVEHAPKLAKIAVDGVHVNSRWIDLAAIGQSRMKPVSHWQQENFDDIASAHAFVFYVEPGDNLKGALVELGYAIGIERSVWIAGDGHGVDVKVSGFDEPLRLPHRDVVPWGMYRQRIKIVASLDAAFSSIKATFRPERIIDRDGKVVPPVDADIISLAGRR